MEKMMRKNLLAASFLFLGSSLLAQTVSSDHAEAINVEKYKVETNPFWSDCFISVGGGTQLYFGDHNKQMSFGDRLSPALDIALGKWFTPGLGIRLMYSGVSAKGVTQNGSHSTGRVYDASQELYDQKFDLMHLHGDILFNLSNLLCGYNEKRFYSLSPYVGLGWMSTCDSPKTHEVSANLGLLNSFRLSSAFDLNLDVRSSLVNDRFDGEVGGRKEEGLLSASVGLTYHLGHRGWKRVSGLSNAEIRSLGERVSAMQFENDSLRNRLSSSLSAMSSNVDTVIDKNSVSFPYLIVFPIGKSTLSNANLVNLGFLSQAIRESKDVVYVVTGYADNTTGSASLNARLSQARARTVYDALVNVFGVPSSCLKIASKGGVDNLFYGDPRLSRSVIIQVE